MTNEPNKLLPSEDELKTIVTQLMEVAPMQIPEALLRVQLARLVMGFLERIRGELDESIKRLEDEINKK